MALNFPDNPTLNQTYAEGDTLRLTASANSDLEAVCSYEEIS